MEKKQKNGLLAAATLVIAVSNAVSLVTTATGLKAAYFQQNTVMNLVMVGAISLTIQLVKASLDRVPDKSGRVLIIYLAALSLSSAFSAQAMICAAYPADHFAETARQNLSSGYTTQLLDVQSAVSTDLNTARSAVWDELEAIRSSLNVEQVQQTALDNLSSSMLDKYTEANGWVPAQDSFYNSLKNALQDVENGDLDAAMEETETSLENLKVEDRDQDGSDGVEKLRLQLKAIGTRSDMADLRKQLIVQLEAAIQRQEMLRARFNNHEQLQNDFETVLIALGKADSGDAKAADCLDQLEYQMLQKNQDVGTIRSLLDEVVENADAEMNLRRVAELHQQVEDYLTLLDVNTTLLNNVNALEQLPAEEAAAESWQTYWNNKVGTLKQLVASTPLTDSAKKGEFVGKLDQMMRWYTTEHSSPLEYCVICIVSKGRGLAVLCMVIALLLDLSGYAAGVVARNQKVEKA